MELYEVMGAPLLGPPEPWEQASSGVLHMDPCSHLQGGTVTRLGRVA